MERRTEQAIDLLRQLVRTPSPSGEEGRAGDTGTVVGILEEEGRRHGTEVTVDPITPRSANVVECLGRGRGLFVIEAHTDVVPEGDPALWFGGDPRSAATGSVEYLGGARVRLRCGDRARETAVREAMDRTWRQRPERSRRVLFGRGAFDNKAADAVTALTLSALAAATRETGVALDGIVAGAYTADEESGQTGVVRLVEWLRRRGLLDRPARPDGFLEGAFGVALEGSYGWAPVVGHRGILQGRIRTSGRGAHASTPTYGVNATLQMARALLALEDGGPAFRQALAAPLETGLLGPPTIAVGTTVVGGGVRSVRLTSEGAEIDRSGLNSVPDWCEATFDVRFPPAREGGYGGGADHVLATIRDRLATTLDPAAGTWSVDLVRPWETGVALGATMEEVAAHPLVRAARTRAAQVLGHEPHLEIAPGGTDATVLVGAGRMATLVEWGPGGGLSHAANEFVEIDGIAEGARALALLAVDLLGVA